MSKLNWLLGITLCLCLWNTSVNSSLATMRFKIVFSEPSFDVILEKKRIMNIYHELSYGVNDDSMFEIILINKDVFLGDLAEAIELKGNVLILYLDKNGRLSIEGFFGNVCESEIVKKTWLFK